MYITYDETSSKVVVLFKSNYVLTVDIDLDAQGRNTLEIVNYTLSELDLSKHLFIKKLLSFDPLTNTPHFHLGILTQDDSSSTSLTLYSLQTTQKAEGMLEYVTLEASMRVEFNCAENGWLMSDSYIYRFVYMSKTS